jgi:type II secretory pathway pseudopilin PulG
MQNTTRSVKKGIIEQEAGFSLMELLVVCVIMVIILGIITTVVSGLQTNYHKRRIATQQINDGAAALDLLTRIVRVAGANTTSQALTPTGNNQLRVRADWNPVDGALSGQYEDVTFFVSGNSLYMRNENTNKLTEMTTDVSAINFQYYTAGGIVTIVPAQIARVKISLNVGTDLPRSFTSTVLIRKGLQIK